MWKRADSTQINSFHSSCKMFLYSFHDSRSFSDFVNFFLRFFPLFSRIPSIKVFSKAKNHICDMLQFKNEMKYIESLLCTNRVHSCFALAHIQWECLMCICACVRARARAREISNSPNSLHFTVQKEWKGKRSPKYRNNINDRYVLKHSLLYKQFEYQVYFTIRKEENCMETTISISLNVSAKNDKSWDPK